MLLEPLSGSEEQKGRPPQLRYKPWLDGWRGIAILVVLMGHLLPIIPGKPARFGVELFFVLSGRLMAELLFINQQPLGYFFKRRIARVWPALYLFVFVMALVFATPGPNHVDKSQIFGALTYTFNYVRIMTGPVLVLDHLWSLCVEEWSYLFLAVIALVTRRVNVRAANVILVIAALSALNGILQTWWGGLYRDVYWRTDVRIASIFVSCGLYLILCKRNVPGAVPIVAGLMGVFFHSPLFPDVVKYSIGTLLLGVSVATIDTGPGFALRILSSKPLTYMGLWSYSIYLWQQPFTKILHHWPFAAKLALLMAAALTSYYLVELPARRYLNRIWADRSRKRMSKARVVEEGPAL